MYNRETKEQKNKETKKQKIVPQFLDSSVSQLVRSLHSTRGQAALATVLAGMFISLSIGIGISTIAFLNIQRLQHIAQRAQSYYAAEAGIEDALLRVIDPDLSYQTNTTYTLSVGSGTASTSISLSGTNLQILSDGYRGTSHRRLETLLEVTSGNSFVYGAQVGDGGVLMENNSVVIGTLYSNGNVAMKDLAQIQGEVFVGGSHTLSKANVTADAHANRIEDSIIGRDAYYQSILNTTVGGTSYPNSENPTQASMPITQSQIDAWKAEAAAGGILNGDLDLSGNNTDSRGPLKINGNLNIQNTGILTMTGTIWVTGNVTLKNSGAIQLSSSYGNRSGVMVVDGTVTIENSFVLCGSEGFNGTNCNVANGKSYLLMLSTNTGDPAILMKGTVDLNGVLYTSGGTLTLENNARIKSGTAYRLHLKNNAVIIYEIGLINLNFTEGPGGGWDIQSWKEVN